MLVVTTTTGDRELAERIATELVDRRLAACVQVSGPIRSHYRWEGKAETADEWLLTAKTVEQHWPAIEALVDELHPYDTPELIATPITHASAAYEKWLREQTDLAPGQ